MPTVTIGFVPRERFSLAAESLQKIFDLTDIPFELIVVDCNVPPPYRQQVRDVLKGRNDVQVIETAEYLLPNQSRNLIIPRATSDFLCLIENDVLVTKGWLSKLIAACEECPSDVAIPLIFQGRGTKEVHFDSLLGDVEEVQTGDGVKLAIRPRKTNRQLDKGSDRRFVKFVEQHCVLFRKSAVDKIGLYDERLNTRDEIDLSLAAHRAGLSIVLEPKCEVHYLPPYTLDLPALDEMDYFFMKWDLKHAAESREIIREKWNLVETPGDMGFVKERNLVGQMRLVKQEIQGLIAPTESFVLIDQGWWLGVPLFKDLKAVPFVERNGKYWGKPADDQTAISELERLLKTGIKSVVVGWPGFVWLEYYPGLHRYLRSKFKCQLENERLIVFNVEPAESAGPIN